MISNRAKKNGIHINTFLLAGIFFCLTLPAYGGDVDFRELGFQNISTYHVSNNELTIRGDNPIVLVTVKGKAEENNWLNLEFKRKTDNNQLLISFMKVGENFRDKQLKRFSLIEYKAFETKGFDLNELPLYDGDIDFLGITFIGEKSEIVIRRIEIKRRTPGDYLLAGLYDAFRYKPFTPRSINFLEGPLWHGDYINKPLLKILFTVTILSIVLFIVFKSRKIRHKLVIINVSVFAMMWLFLDILHSSNQYKILHDFAKAENIMENSRTGKTGFIDFLDFIKLNTEEGAVGIFLAPYPFHFEGKYHLYPHIRFGPVDKADYIFTLSKPDSGGHGYDRDKKMLTYNGANYSVEKEIPFSRYETIYKIK